LKTTIGRITAKRESLGNFLPKEIARIRKTLETAVSGNFLDAIEAYEKERNTFISKYRQCPLGSESFLVVLRRWNSYTPSLPVAQHNMGGLNQYSIGGGYYFFLQSEEGSLNHGYGLVIDPGYNFIHNFGSAGFCLDDIDGILMTHAHNDHTNDFESLLSLLYQRNHKYKGEKSPKKVDLFLNVGSFKKFSNYLDLSKPDEKDYIGKVVVMSPGQAHRIPGRDDIDCDILTLYTNHHEIVTADYALGLCLRIGGRNILFTGDTGWTLETSFKNEDFLRNFKIHTKEEATTGNIDLLISHIGTVTRKEFDLAEKQPIEEVFYDKHLGALGVIATVEQWKPTTCIISEFGEELTHVRANMVKEIENTLKKLQSELHCIPGDVGLFVFLDSKTALCYASQKLVPVDSLIFDETETNGVKTIKYYSEEPIKLLSPERKNDLVRELPTTNGIQYYKQIYLDKVVKDYKFTTKNKMGLIALFDSLVMDDDPWSMEEYNTAVNGLFCALSTLIEEPEELIEILRNNPHTIGVVNILETYNLESPIINLLYKLTETCHFSGFGEKNPLHEEKLLNEHYAKFPGLIIDACTEKQYGKAEDLLKKLKCRDLTEIWETISEKDRLHILFENLDEEKELVLNENEQKAIATLKCYKNNTNLLKTQINAIVDQLSPDRCWQAGAPTLDMIIDGLNDSLSKQDTIVDKSEIEKALTLCELLDRQQNKMMEISEKGHSVIEKYVSPRIQLEEPERQFLFTLYYAFKLKADSKTKNDEIEDFLITVRQLIDQSVIKE